MRSRGRRVDVGGASYHGRDVVNSKKLYVAKGERQYGRLSVEVNYSKRSKG